jgi:hypothetical protein
VHHRRAQGATPGSEAASSFTLRLRGNQGDPIVGVEGAAYPRTSVRSEDEGRSGRKSEAPIRAMNPGNAGEAKGYRFEITGEGDMARHWADYDHDNTICSFHTEGACRTAAAVQLADGFVV